jgi:AraC family transcriptional regulator
MLTNPLSSEFSPNMVFDGTPLPPSSTDLPLPADRRAYPGAGQRERKLWGSDLSAPVVEMSPPQALSRRTVISDGITAEIVQVGSRDRFAFRFRAPVHLLVVYEQGARREGDTVVEGLARSTLREFSRRLTFVPAGREFREWQEPRTNARLMFLYLDPAKLGIIFDAGGEDNSFAAKLFFEDQTLLETALKLKRSLESPTAENRLYLEALGMVLAHEVISLNRGKPRIEAQIRGGLASWQQRVVTGHIEAHLGDPISLAALAQLARLSPYYFCRAFKQSFGIPPHRYHTSRRIDHAKSLLANRTQSITDIGLTIGYSETSSFSAAFRRATGLTPSAYRRSLA